MRILAAAIFVFCAMFAAMALVAEFGGPHVTGWIAGTAVIVAMLGSMLVSMWLFHPRWMWPGLPESERLRLLDEAGLLETATFRATRAFGVDTDWLHYFIELDTCRPRVTVSP